MISQAKPVDVGCNPESAIRHFSSDFAKWVTFNPQIGAAIKSDLITLIGIEETELADENLCFVKIPVDNTLAAFGSVCGFSGNKCFAGAALDLLKKSNVDFIVGISEQNSPRLHSIAAPISKESSQELSTLVDLAHGTLDPRSHGWGWAVLESI